MAGEGNSNNVKMHVESYSRFASLMKWGTIISFITAAVVVLIIAS